MTYWDGDEECINCNKTISKEWLNKECISCYGDEFNCPHCNCRLIMEFEENYNGDSYCWIEKVMIKDNIFYKIRDHIYEQKRKGIEVEVINLNYDSYKELLECEEVQIVMKYSSGYSTLNTIFGIPLMINDKECTLL